ncbi:hypothetical protein JCM10207_002811 [Rhodosporidiobolus poonsookiae]
MARGAKYTLSRTEPTTGSVTSLFRASTQQHGRLERVVHAIVIVVSARRFCRRARLNSPSCRPRSPADLPSPHRTESLTLHPSLGLQLASSRVLAFGFSADASAPPHELHVARRSRLVPLSSVRSVVINEGLQGCEGKHYLALVTESPDGERKAEVVFPSLLPHLDVLILVRKSILPDLPPP